MNLNHIGFLSKHIEEYTKKYQRIQKNLQNQRLNMDLILSKLIYVLQMIMQGFQFMGGPYGDISYYYNTSYQVMFTNQSQLSTLLSVKDKLKMPRSDDIMEFTKNKIFMNVKIKDPREDIVFPYIVKLLEKYDYYDQISISSFNHNYYNKIVEFNKNNKLGKKLSFGFLFDWGSDNKIFP